MSNSLNTMDCECSLRNLPRCLDGELGGEAQVALNQHLEHCPACREELARLKADLGYLAGASVPELPPFMATRVMAEVRSRQVAGLRRGFGLGRVLGSAAAVLLVCASIGIGTALGAGLGRTRANTAASEELTVSSNEPTFADVLTSVVEGD